MRFPGTGAHPRFLVPALVALAILVVGELTVAQAGDSGLRQAGPTTATLQIWSGETGRVHVVDPASGAVKHTCQFDFVSNENNTCVWPADGTTAAIGTKVRLIAEKTKDDFVGWSTFECPGRGTCDLTLDGDRSVTAIFRRITLRVALAGQGSVTSNPAGIRCPTPPPENSPVCTAEFDAGTKVTLTAVPAVAGQPVSWSSYGCEQINDRPPTGPTCVVPVEGHFAGVGFGEPFPELPFQVSHRFRVSISGSGFVTGGGLNCRARTCTREYPAGQSLTLAARAAPGWAFKRWIGGCAKNPCRLSVGPVTSIHAEFQRQVVTPPAQKLAAAVTRIVVSRTRRARRITVRLAVNKPSLAQMRLSRRGRTVIAGRFVRLQKGTNKIVLAVPRRVRAGRYRLDIVIGASGGDKVSIRRRVRLGR